MQDFQIRDARLSDTATVADFNLKMALETEGRKLDRETLAAGVAGVFEDTSRGRYWVAEADGQVIGQLMVTEEWSDWRNGSFWWIQSVYVREDYRRRGVFSALHRHVAALARSTAQVCGLRLYVERENERARKTYQALGMVSPGYEVMEQTFHQKFN